MLRGYNAVFHITGAESCPSVLHLWPQLLPSTCQSRERVSGLRGLLQGQRLVPPPNFSSLAAEAGQTAAHGPPASRTAEAVFAGGGNTNKCRLEGEAKCTELIQVTHV